MYTHTYMKRRTKRYLLGLLTTIPSAFVASRLEIWIEPDYPFGFWLLAMSVFIPTMMLTFAWVEEVWPFDKAKAKEKESKSEETNKQA